MPTLGETLKQKREERGISLAEISEATKIGTRFLKAIESDNFSILPGGIFTRSFIRAYARTVRLDEEEAISLYHQQIAPASEEPIEEPAASKPAPVVVMESPRRSGPLTFSQPAAQTRRGPLIVGVIITVFVAVLIYVVIKRIDKGQAESPPSPPPITRQTPPQTETPPQTSAPPVAQTGDQLMVRVEAATGDCWLRYTIDGGEASQLILKQGEARDLPAAQNEVVLKYGNRQTIKVLVNNREITFPPDAPKFRGEIKLSRDNLQSLFN
jgi:cytoskeletal protein RodZ